MDPWVPEHGVVDQHTLERFDILLSAVCVRGHYRCNLFVVDINKRRNKNRTRERTCQKQARFGYIKSAGATLPVQGRLQSSRPPCAETWAVLRSRIHPRIFGHDG